MTELLEYATDLLRQLPAPMQDSAVRAVILQLEEEPGPGDLEPIDEGRRQFANGDYTAFDTARGPTRTT